MHLLWRRYTRSGHAPSWFYVAMALAFAALAAWALVRTDWLVAVVATIMVVATLGGSRLMRRLRQAHDVSETMQREAPDA
ncbi:MAG: hypothetical protein WEC75_10610 [Dehalococcoidia bacterium]